MSLKSVVPSCIFTLMLGACQEWPTISALLEVTDDGMENTVHLKLLCKCFIFQCFSKINIKNHELWCE